MDAIAAFMQNETAVITVGFLGMLIGAVGCIGLGALTIWSAFVHRLPGGIPSLLGFTICAAMFAFSFFATSTMELQYGPQGPVVEYSIYAIGGLLVVLGYIRLTLQVARSRRQCPNSAVSNIAKDTEI